jgi:hypothetical protein
MPAAFFCSGASIQGGLVRRSDWRDNSAAMVSRLASVRRSFEMRFMMIVKNTDPVPPTPELLEAMHKLADREIKAGRMLENGGLMPLAMGAHVRVAGGELSVIDGPFVEAKEVVGGYAIFELRNKEEAVASAVEFMQLHKDLLPGWEGTCEIRTFASRES